MKYLPDNNLNQKFDRTVANDALKGTLPPLMIPTQNSLVICQIYYMASSASGQEEANTALWLATRAGKMERYCPLGIALFVPGIKFRRSPNSSRSIKTQKENLANIQPSWPRAWSIMYGVFQKFVDILKSLYFIEIFYISLHFLWDVNRSYCLSIFRTVLWVR